MSNVKKEDRVDGTEIRKLNHLGLGLRAIGRKVGCHAATVKVRLEEMEVEPIDTRHNFMEDIYDSLSPEEQEWLADNLYNRQMPIKEFISRMIKEAFFNAPAAPAAAPTPLPVAPQYTVNDDEVKELAELSKTLTEITGQSPIKHPLKDLFSE